MAQSARLYPIPPGLRGPHFPSALQNVHPLDIPYGPFTNPQTLLPLRPLCNIFIILLSLLLTRIEEFIFASFRARFVPGDEPWLAWARAQRMWFDERREKAAATEDTRSELGSTLRT